jgi:dienelactone hydrolase
MNRGLNHVDTMPLTAHSGKASPDGRANRPSHNRAFLKNGPVNLPSFAMALLMVEAAIAETLPSTTPLQGDGDRAAEMVGAIDRRLDDIRREALERRVAHWREAMSDPVGRNTWTAQRRLELKRILGVIDPRVAPVLRTAAPFDPANPDGTIGQGRHHKVHHVAWAVFRGITGEGLLLEPDAPCGSAAVLVPDVARTPSELAEDAGPASLADAGVRVLIPCLIDRSPRFDRYSGREVLWRAAYEMGRTPPGYDIQRALAAADWLAARGAKTLGIAGWGEGGGIALHAGALDSRFAAVHVAGYFAPHDALENEPIDRNAFGYTLNFGAAEVAALLPADRLSIDDAGFPQAEFTDAHGGAPGALRAPSGEEIRGEAARLVSSYGGTLETGVGLQAFARRLGVSIAAPPVAAPPVADPPATGGRPDWKSVRDAQFEAELEDVQELWRQSHEARKAYWSAADYSNATAFGKSTAAYRDRFRREVLGVAPAAPIAGAPEVLSRFIDTTEGVRRHEVRIELGGGVFAYGILCIPDGSADGARRPAVVCQHGLEGRPADVSDPKVDSQFYHRFGFQLAKRGFVTFAPQNPYVGDTRFRQVLRKAQPLGLTLWSFIVPQHEAITAWLASLPFVDGDRIGFYGLSYGGKTAMRVPAVIPRYKLSICSADYNEWIEKCVTSRSGYSYLHTREYDMPEWNLGNTFNYAEMSWLIFPRPFMVERGHDDGVAPDEWVAAEYARTRRTYDQLGLGDRTEIEIFNGPHTIHGAGTYSFLDRWLKAK